MPSPMILIREISGSILPRDIGTSSCYYRYCLVFVNKLIGVGALPQAACRMEKSWRKIKHGRGTSRRAKKTVEKKLESYSRERYARKR